MPATLIVFTFNGIRKLITELIFPGMLQSFVWMFNWMLNTICSIPFKILSIIWFFIKYSFLVPIIIFLELYIYRRMISRAAWRAFVTHLFSKDLKIVLKLKRRPFFDIEWLIFEYPIKFNFNYFMDFLANLTAAGIMAPIVLAYTVCALIVSLTLTLSIFYFSWMFLHFMYRIKAQWIRRFFFKNKKKK